MPTKDEGTDGVAGENADIGKAYQELAEAENQASLMENQLAMLEQKLDAFLAEHDNTDGEETIIGNGEASSDGNATENHGASSQ